MSSPQRKLRLLVLSVSVGSGHVRAAQSVCATAEEEFADIQTHHLDILELVSDGFRKLYGSGYIKLVEKAPQLWAYMYHQMDRPSSNSLFDQFRLAVERLSTKKLDSEIASFAPDVILCTHFLPAELLSRSIAKGNAMPPVWVQVTDFDVHGLWMHPHMKGYFVASDEVAARLSARGIPEQDIHVSGIAIMPQFRRPPARHEAAIELGLDPEIPTLLMMSGGVGMEGMEVLVEEVATLDENIQIVALAARNQDLLEKLEKVAQRFPKRVFPQGFTRTIERVMAAADLAITKPGGLTTSECLAMRLPMIIVSPIPGQEERNSDTLLEAGCAVKAVDSAALLYKLKRLINHPEYLATMRKNQEMFAKPQAARTILETIRRAV